MPTETRDAGNSLFLFLGDGEVPPSPPLADTRSVNVAEYEKMYCFQNLYNAHKAARRGKRDKTEVIRFEMDLAENLCKLQNTWGRFCCVNVDIVGILEDVSGENLY